MINMDNKLLVTKILVCARTHETVANLPMELTHFFRAFNQTIMSVNGSNEDKYYLVASARKAHL
jgi:hypothetical protein